MLHFNYKNFIILLLILISNTLLIAGNTGKIAGIVTDKQTNEPLAGANIIVESIWREGIEEKLKVPTGASTDMK